MESTDLLRRTGLANIKARRTAYNKIETKKQDILAKPRAIDKMVSDLAIRLSPSDRAPRYAKYATRAAAVDNAVPSGHPQEGFATALDKRFRTALQNPNNKGYSHADILNAVASDMYTRPDETGESVWSRSNKYYREDDAFLGSKLKKPMGYDAWKEETRRREDIEYEKESTWAGPGEILSMAAIGAGIGAATTGGLGAVPAAIVGGVGAIIAHPLSKLLHGTEGYRANANSDNWIDKFQAGAIGTVLPYALSEGALTKGVGSILAKKAAKTATNIAAATERKNVHEVLNRLTKGQRVTLNYDGTTLPDAPAMIEHIKGMNKINSSMAAKSMDLSESIKKNLLTEALLKDGEEVATPLFKALDNAPTKAPVTQKTMTEKGVKAFLQLESENLTGRALLDPDGMVIGSMRALNDQNVSRVALQPKKLAAYMDKAKSLLKVKSYNPEAASRAIETFGGDLRAKDMLADFSEEMTSDVVSYMAKAGIKEVESSEVVNSLVPTLAKFGVGVGVFAAFTTIPAEESEASWLTPIFKTGSAILKMSEHMKATGLIAEGIEKGQVLLKESNIQKGLFNTTDEVAKSFTGNIRSMLAKHTGSGMLYRGMTPAQIFEHAMGAKEGIMLNPAVQKVSYYMAEMTNIRNSTQVVKNIAARVGMKSEYSKLKLAFDDIAELAAADVEHNFHRAKVSDLAKQIKKLTKKSGKNLDDKAQDMLDVWTKELDVSTKRMNELKPRSASYYKEYDRIAQELAPESQSLRISLALDSKADFKKYPWLKDMLTEDDKIVIGHTREFLNTYKKRMLDRGLPVIEEGYFPHRPNKAIHEMLNKVDPSRHDAAAYSKFYSRKNPIARPAVPDYGETLNWYIKDAEKRLNNFDFWETGGWKDVMNSEIVKGNDALSVAFRDLHVGSNPVEWTNANKAAAYYANFEVFKRIWLSPSAAFKHGLKVFASLSQLPVSVSAPAVVAATKSTFLKLADDAGALDKLVKLGLTKKESAKVIRDMSKSMIGTNVTRQMLIDSSLDVPMETFTKIQKMLNKLQDAGSVMINTSEFFDRAVSVEAGARMMTKKGLTPDQAVYGIYNQILTDNFLSREFNAPWLKSPKIRALTMFQATPFKIAERRVVAALRTGRSFAQITKNVKVKLDAGEGAKVLEDFRNIRAYIKGAEKELKANIFVDGLRTETDFYGTPIAKQFMMEMATAGAATYGAGVSIDAALQHHFFHVPFLDPRDHRAALSLNPIIQAAMKTAHYRDETDDSFFMTDFMQNWLGSGGIVPMSVVRFNNILEGEAPDIYGTGKAGLARYFMSIPAKSEYK